MKCFISMTKMKGISSPYNQQWQQDKTFTRTPNAKKNSLVRWPITSINLDSQAIWWDQMSIYYELLGDHYRAQLKKSSDAVRLKRTEYAKSHDKVIFQHVNMQPHVAQHVNRCIEPPSKHNLFPLPRKNCWIRGYSLHGRSLLSAGNLSVGT